MAVKIRRERPDQRRHHRVTAPLFVSVGGHSLRAADWSLGGLRLEKFPGKLPELGTALRLELTLPFQGFDVGFHVTAEVVRQDPAAAMFAVRFTEIGERERELMQHFIEELVRGSMSDIEDTIQRIDVPVTPASLEPDKPRLQQPSPATGAVEFKGARPAARLPVRMLAMSGVYLAIGALVLGYAALLLYTNLFRIEVQSAVISAPVETVTAQADGRIDLSEVKAGDAVRSGQVIAGLVDTELSREIEIAGLEVQAKKAKIAFLKQRQLEELDRIKGYANVEMKNVQQTRVEVEALAQQLRISGQNYERLKSLYDKGFVTDTKLQEAEKQLITMKKELEIRRIELKSRVELAEDNLGKRMYSGDATVGNANIIGGGADLEAEVRLAEHEVTLMQQRYLAFLASKETEQVRAPFDGTVLELPRFKGSSVRRGDVIAVIEQRTNREVVAFLTQDQVLKVGLGDEALIYVPALGETVKGRVAGIDRTSGFLDEQERRITGGYTWRGSGDRSAKVKIAFTDDRAVGDAERYRSGLPVTVVFDQRAASSFLANVARTFGL